eukprot:TRINITY_DN19672_c1_g1_i1.p1 TRINITY_DN19672_c1_g1~~TRINITY_DN19672_c1_g1_i1.p1  ORF type:complete len:255 (-),score=19.74 TRINITY_DN19672_c1_g1_i1:6-770(-)
MDGLADVLQRHRSCVWGGVGAALCLKGGCYRYTVYFFPLLRVSEPADVAKLLNHLSSVLAQPPSSIHPMLWRTFWALCGELVSRVFHIQALIDQIVSGVLVCTALWLCEAPGSFSTVSGVYPAWRSWRSQVLTSLRRYAGNACSAFSSLLPLNMRLPFQQIGPEFLIWTLLCTPQNFKCDRLASTLVNSALGVELLQRACRETLAVVPQSRSIFWGLVDMMLVGFGAWGVARQHELSQATLKGYWSDTKEYFGF